MADDLVKKTSDTAKLYFEGATGERPYELWRGFDKRLARDLSIFVTGQMYAREVIPHPVRQMVTVAALTVYDMVKAIDRSMSIGDIRLLEKTGGTHGDWRRSEQAPETIGGGTS